MFLQYLQLVQVSLLPVFALSNVLFYSVDFSFHCISMINITLIILKAKQNTNICFRQVWFLWYWNLYFLLGPWLVHLQPFLPLVLWPMITCSLVTSFAFLMVVSTLIISVIIIYAIYKLFLFLWSFLCTHLYLLLFWGGPSIPQHFHFVVLIVWNIVITNCFIIWGFEHFSQHFKQSHVIIY